MKKTLLAGIMALSLVACKDQPATEVSTPETTAVGFNKVLDDYYEDGLTLNPLNATMSGDNRYMISFQTRFHKGIKPQQKRTTPHIVTLFKNLMITI